MLPSHITNLIPLQDLHSSLPHPAGFTTQQEMEATDLHIHNACSQLSVYKNEPASIFQRLENSEKG